MLGRGIEAREADLEVAVLAHDTLQFWFGSAGRSGAGGCQVPGPFSLDGWLGGDGRLGGFCAALGGDEGGYGGASNVRLGEPES